MPADSGVRAAANSVVAAVREFAATLQSLRTTVADLTQAVTKLESTVSRYIVVFERQLAARDHAERQSKGAPTASSAMRDEVRRKMRGEK